MKNIMFSISSIITILFSLQYGSTIVNCVDDNTFIGSTSSDWDTASNWSAGCVPDGTITGTITISADCTVSSINATSYVFGTGSSLLIDDGVTFTNNGSGSWTIAELTGDGNYVGNLTLTGTIKPGAEIACTGVIHPAFYEFNSNSVTVSLNGTDVDIVSTGLPNHTSPYWNSNNSLYISPVVASQAQMSPGFIQSGSYSLTVPVDPVIAATTSSTSLGAIGIAVSGAPIYNGKEGPNIPLSANVASGFDYAGGHNGPTGYHYHLESQNVSVNTTLSYDDDALVGVMQDGFFLYGRKCSSTGGHPTNLDASGGHTTSTQHCGTSFYHYHIVNQYYTGTYILLFGVDLKGTPNSIF